jgi:hypothetical protein
VEFEFAWLDVLIGSSLVVANAGMRSGMENDSAVQKMFPENNSILLAAQRDAHIVLMDTILIEDIIKLNDKHYKRRSQLTFSR